MACPKLRLTHVVSDFEVEGQLRKCWPKRTWEKQVEEESVKVGLRRKHKFIRSKWCWHKSDYCWIEVNLATLTPGRNYLMLYIGFSVNDHVCLNKVGLHHDATAIN